MNPATHTPCHSALLTTDLINYLQFSKLIAVSLLICDSFVLLSLFLSSVCPCVRLHLSYVPVLTRRVNLENSLLMLTHRLRKHTKTPNTPTKFLDTESGTACYFSSWGGWGPPADGYGNRPEPLGRVWVSCSGKQHHRDWRAQQAI